MIVSLPMYDRAETAADTDALWQSVRTQLGYGPQQVDRDIDLWDAWLGPDLLLSQTCGLPYRTRLHGKVQLLGSPDYGLPGCPPGYYNSVFVTRHDTPGTLVEIMTRRVVINQTHSQSGYGSLYNFARERGLTLGPICESGGHVFSARMVADGVGDITAIDAHSWRLIQRFDPHAAALRELARTEPTPATPFITSLGQDADALRCALSDGIAALPRHTRDNLNLHGIAAVPAAAYLDVPNPPNR
ncbi:phosphate/phosphite/phosphonate ABC transporter substrate-binding protein [Puniceibacterium sp. IMCC21224]|uniref:phosphate/phosphite/phosphonate ABC transporter substrate-binding protein n=1 Tax=Puniceibacterium sp. IMCC21224 TaxID=1618204 RepID=UPI00064DDA25|nr:PhnD/SsuA/transferrin family substrate-binding protein [Puniceibacterium sp. IMCC21224]KMK66807.1 ABC transporter, phosphonate, periplasmic substrate-binding protein [Puniceibacterium sp. IMCC21224]